MHGARRRRSLISWVAFFVAVAALSAAGAEALVPAGASPEPARLGAEQVETVGPTPLVISSSSEGPRPRGPMLAQLGAQIVAVDRYLPDGR